MIVKLSGEGGAIVNLRKKRQLELNDQKEKRKEEVIIAAIDVFKEKGIDAAKMIDIAERAEVGVASVYRYFKTKTELAVESAIYLWDKDISILYEQFESNDFISLNGAEKVKRILELFVSIYKSYPEFFGFMEHFDNYIIKEGVPKERLEDYEENIISLKTAMICALEEGMEDGSIKTEVDKNAFYMTVSHALFSLCQKLILRGNVLKSDAEVAGDKQLELLIDMAMIYIIK